MKINSKYEHTGLEIAIIGIACRVPDANNWREFWENLIQGKESIKFFSDKEIIESGVEQSELTRKDFVKAGSVLKNKNHFDSAFFEYRPDEARMMNPEHRIFHECVWEALEDAGCDPANVKGKIGLYAGAGQDLSWQIHSTLKNTNNNINSFYLSQINNKDYLAALLSYKLNLKGPAISINTACSTSLVAVHMACRSILMGDNRVAVAGGISLNFSKQKGYKYVDGLISSPDGQCKAFDADASGTVSGEGVGLVVLKRLKDALEDGDNVYAIIKGSAINNDGNRKPGFTTPSIEGQIECIKRAQKFSKVEPETISYIETHGTGTKLGDPIEIKALNEAFSNVRKKFCAIGSVKTNLGHLDTAAGVIGLIKAALSLKFRQIPASLNFKTPNPEADFEDGPFFVNTELKEWVTINDVPRRAGVSSFGIGGTNAHVILEESTDLERLSLNKKQRLFVLSAKTNSSLVRQTKEYKNYLEKNVNIDLDNLCYTLQQGRKEFAYRRSIVFDSFDNLITQLNKDKYEERKSEKAKPVVFVFPGQGTQYINMGRELYECEEVFRTHLDNGFKYLRQLTDKDFETFLFCDVDSQKNVNNTEYAQPLLFLVEYALSKLLTHYGIYPEYVIGHSVGEYTAACISGVLSFESTLEILVKRGQLTQSLSGGSMLSAAISELESVEYISKQISLAAVNTPNQVVFSGSELEIDKLSEKLKGVGIPCVKLQSSRAFHSQMLDIIMPAFGEALEKITLSNPQIKFVSNLTGKIILPNEIIDAGYWLRHLRETVQFSKGISALISEHKELTFVEVGPGITLTGLIRQHNLSKNSNVLNTMHTVKNTAGDTRVFYTALADLWSKGFNLNWDAFYRKEDNRLKIPLPTYSFESINYISEIDVSDFGSFVAFPRITQSKDFDKWFYRRQWKQNQWIIPNKTKNKKILIITNSDSLYSKWDDLIKKNDSNIIIIRSGNDNKKISGCLYSVNFNANAGLDYLIEIVNEFGFVPEKIVLAPIDLKANLKDKNFINFSRSVISEFNEIRSLSFELNLISNQLVGLYNNEKIELSNALLFEDLLQLALANNLQCKIIDVDKASIEDHECLLNEISYSDGCNEIALRRSTRFVRGFEKLTHSFKSNFNSFTKDSVILIIGEENNKLTAYLTDIIGATVLTVNAVTTVVKVAVQDHNKIIALEFERGTEKKLKKKIDLIEERVGNISGIIYLTDSVGEKVIEQPNTRMAYLKLINLFLKEDDIPFIITCTLNESFESNTLKDTILIHRIYESLLAESQNNAQIFNTEFFIKEITPSDMVSVFQRVLQLKVPSVLACSTDIDSFRNEAHKKENPEIEFHNIKSNERPELTTEYVAPKSETEIRLVSLFEDFFGIQKIGVEDDFFELGGDSLKAMVVVEKIKKQFGVNLTLRDFFSCKNVKQLALEIDGINWLKVDFSTNNEIII